MSYQSEAQLEQQLIDQLKGQDYGEVAIPDYDALVANFRIQFEKFNAAKLTKPLSDKEWERVLNHLNGKSIFESVLIAVVKCVLAGIIQGISEQTQEHIVDKIINAVIMQGLVVVYVIIATT